MWSALAGEERHGFQSTWWRFLEKAFQSMECHQKDEDATFLFVYFFIVVFFC